MQQQYACYSARRTAIRSNRQLGMQAALLLLIFVTHAVGKLQSPRLSPWFPRFQPLPDQPVTSQHSARQLLRMCKEHWRDTTLDHFSWVCEINSHCTGRQAELQLRHAAFCRNLPLMAVQPTNKDTLSATNIGATMPLLHQIRVQSFSTLAMRRMSPCKLLLQSSHLPSTCNCWHLEAEPSSVSGI